MSTVYFINRGVNKPIVFRGLIGAYIWWFVGALLGAMLLFAVLYIAGVPMAACLVITGGTAGLFILRVYRLNRKYGEHGWMKQRAKRGIPTRIVCDQFFNK